MPTLVDVNVFNSDLLLSLSAVPVWGFQKRDVCPGEFIGVIKILASSYVGLICNHGAAETFHSGVVRGQQLSGNHAFHLVLGID
jgi:hypothetical protein